MTDRIFKAAMVAALDAMTEQELAELSNDHYIFHFEDFPEAVQAGSYNLFEMSDLIEYHIAKLKTDRNLNGWSVIMTQVLDALWAIHDDPSEKTKVFLEWIAKQQ